MTRHDELQMMIAGALMAPSDECLVWRGATAAGYPNLRTPEGIRRGHRIACEVGHGPPPFEGAHALHSCHNKLCVNPEHLRWGTHADNMREAGSVGAMQHGERHSHAKLTARDVRAIRLRYSSGGITQRALAAEYGVAPSVICEVINHNAWSHL